MARSKKPKLRLNTADFSKLMPLVRGDVDSAGRRLAESVRAKVPGDVPVSVQQRTDENGRPVSLVTITHASGLARQAKHGVLTRSAAELGLEVTRYTERGG